jgi:hypothetical protein
MKNRRRTGSKRRKLERKRGRKGETIRNKREWEKK